MEPPCHVLTSYLMAVRALKVLTNRNLLRVFVFKSFLPCISSRRGVIHYFPFKTTKLFFAQGEKINAVGLSNIVYDL
jgi:hypothetical protein